MQLRALVLALTPFLACACGSDDDSAAGGPNDVTEHFFVVNTRSESISVLVNAQLVDTIALGNQPHGQGPSSNGDRVYVTTDGGEGEVIAIDPRTRKVAWRVPAGEELNEPHLTRDNRFLYAPDLLAARTFVVDVERGELAGEIAMVDPADGSNLVALHNTYASYDGEHMYVTAILSHKIAEISVASRQITRAIPVSGEPRPAAITKDDRKMYVQLSELNGFIELDLPTGSETAKIEWPDPGTRPPGYDLGFPTKCHGLGITPDQTELWAASNIDGNVRVYSLPGLEELAAIPLGNLPNWIAFTRDGKTAYITNTDPAAPNGTVSIVDVDRRLVVGTVDVGTAPKRVHRVDVRLD
jgi:DNA-binding beta-propeller fold protein YncE